jgi:hypothetical protein
VSADAFADEVSPNGDGRRGKRRETFSMVPQALTRALPAMALQLYVYLDGVQGENGWPVKGYRKAARDLGWDPHTVQYWAEYLTDLGVVDLSGENTQARTMIVTHNPARYRVVDGVRLPEQKRRSRVAQRAYARPKDTQLRDGVTQSAEASARSRHTALREVATQQLRDAFAQIARSHSPGSRSSEEERCERSEALAPRGTGEDAYEPELLIEPCDSCWAPSTVVVDNVAYCEACRPMDR